MSDLRERYEAARKRAYSLKTKKAQTKAWAVVRELRHEILMGLYAQRNTFATQSVKGTVIVDNSHCMSDYILVGTVYGTMHASPTSDVLSKSWYAHTCCIKYAKGQQVILELEVDVNSESLSIHVYPKRIYGGTLDEAQFAELDKRDDLAFFKHSSGGMTGLFSTKAGA